MIVIYNIYIVSKYLPTKYLLITKGERVTLKWIKLTIVAKWWSPKRYVNILILRTCDCYLTWKESLQMQIS